MSFLNKIFSGNSSEAANTPQNLFAVGVKKNKLETYSNDSDCFIQSIPDKIKGNLRMNFQIPLEDIILLGRDTSFWNNSNQGTVVTSNGLYVLPDNDNPEDILILKWDKISNVKYQDAMIYFFAREEVYHFPLNFFFKTAGQDEKFIEPAKKLAIVLDQMANSVETILQEDRYATVNQLIDEQKFEEAQQQVKKLINESDTDSDKGVAYYFLGEVLNSEVGFIQTKINEKYDEERVDDLVSQRENLEQKAMAAYNRAIEYCPEDDPFIYDIYLEKSYTANNLVDARNFSIEAMQSPDFETSNDAKERYNSLTEALTDRGYDTSSIESDDSLSEEEREMFVELEMDSRFCSSLDYQQRNLLFIVGQDKQIPGCYDKTGNIPCVFSRDKLPRDIHFPIGHPQADTLYLGHPLLPTEYLPFEDATETLYLSKIMEFCYLVQCLGAEEITIRRTKGSDISSSLAKTVGGSIDVGRKMMEASSGLNKEKRNAESSQKADSIELNQKFQPTKYPFCPDGLVWLDSDSTWKNMIKQRLEGNLLNYSEKITSSETTNMTKSQVQNIKASMSYLFLKAKGSMGASVDETFSKTEEKEMVIDIKFRPITEFKKIENNKPSLHSEEQIQPDLSDSEAMFVDEIKFCLEDDGIIDGNEAKYLERKRIKYGISEERAKEIIEKYSSDYTNDEKEYMEVVKDAIVDGEIPDFARRILLREGNSLNISEERAIELENICINNAKSVS